MIGIFVQTETTSTTHLGKHPDIFSAFEDVAAMETL
jgi:hypothetical protein